MQYPSETPGVRLAEGQARIDSLPVPPLAPHEVLIETQASGLTRAEAPGQAGEAEAPCIEVAGLIVSCGDEPLGPQGRLRRGERVAVRTAGPHRRYVVAKAASCLKLPSQLAYEVGLLLIGEALGLPYVAWQNASARPGERAIVAGLDATGFGCLVLLTYLGLEVIVLDPDPQRRLLAPGYGAVRALAPDDAALAAFAPIRHAFLCAADEALWRTALRHLAPGGSAALLPPHLAEAGPALLPAWLAEGRRVIGPQALAAEHLPGLLGLYRGGLPCELLVAQRFPFTQAQDAYEAHWRGSPGKVVLHWAPPGEAAPGPTGMAPLPMA